MQLEQFPLQTRRPSSGSNASSSSLSLFSVSFQDVYGILRNERALVSIPVRQRQPVRQDNAWKTNPCQLSYESCLD